MVIREVDSYGTIYYFNEQGDYHREDGPAIELVNGDRFYFINGLYHRLDGPASEFINERKEYYIMNKLYSYDGWLAIKDYPLLW